jgi:cyclic pyranopterin phosphate synthase
VNVQVELVPGGVYVRARVSTRWRTGVEMEALAATNAALLCVYDMVKSLDRSMVLDGITLLHKSGGRSGTYNRA